MHNGRSLSLKVAGISRRKAVSEVFMNELRLFLNFRPLTNQKEAHYSKIDI